MRYLVTSEEMKRYDKATIEEIGIPGPVLMERAALQTFLCLKERGFVVSGRKVLILAGYGNNGGDGLVLARLLCEANMEVCLWLVGNETKATPDFSLQKKILNAFPVKWLNQKPEDAYAMVVDALFGVGLSRPLEGEYKEAIEAVNGLSGIKIAMDIPSGVSADFGEVLGTAFQADITVTYGFEKKGLYLYPGTNYAGEVILADVGITWRAFGKEKPECFAVEGDLQELLPKRMPDGNKGTFGKVLILAGSYQMAGAAVLCAKACYRAGAGMVKVLTAKENRVILQETLPEALLGDIAEEKDLLSSLAWCDVICIGPGLGLDKAAQTAFEIILGEKGSDGISAEQRETFLKKPLIIDADGLNMLTENERRMYRLSEQGQSGRQIILTPHAGEFLRLWNAMERHLSYPLSMKEYKSKPWFYAKKFAEWLSIIVVAKDARTFICAPKHPVCMNLSGNSGMATAGSGDVLAGILSALVAANKVKRQEEWEEDMAFSAACRAVRVHGLLGDEAAKRLGEHAVMAGDLIP